MPSVAAVMPHDRVSAVRPPGMNRAVISSSPPRALICWWAHAILAANFGRRSARRWSRPLAFMPSRNAVLSPRNAPRAAVAITISRFWWPWLAATPPMITHVSLGTTGITESRKAMTTMISRNHW